MFPRLALKRMLCFKSFLKRVWEANGVKGAITEVGLQSPVQLEMQSMGSHCVVPTPCIKLHQGFLSNIARRHFHRKYD